MSHLSPVVKWLLIINVAVFFLDHMFLHRTPAMMRDGVFPLWNPGAFTIRSGLSELHLWQFVSFQFLHASVWHILFNSIGIYFFGPWLERWWGSKKFLIFYLACGAAGAAFFTLLVRLGVVDASWDSPLVGASAGIYGIFIGVAVIAPDLRVALLFPPIELSMRQLAIAMMAISIGAILLQLGGNEVGEAGHLGGALLGYFLMRYPSLLGGQPGVEIRRPRAFASQAAPKLRPHTEVRTGEDTAVDLILDKISREGFQSLTQIERDILTQAAQRQQNRP